MLREFTCIICPNSCDITVELEGRDICSVAGAGCERGIGYVERELTAPMRTISTSVAVKNGTMPLTSVRLDRAVPREHIFSVMNEIKKMELEAPVNIGDCVIKDVLGLGSNVLVTKNVDRR